jgi:hypothetical protein
MNLRISITFVDPTRNSQRLAIHRNAEGAPGSLLETWVLGCRFPPSPHHTFERNQRPYRLNNLSVQLFS